MFVVNPFFNWVYMVYGILTAGQRTWGGPRADAGAADVTTTPQMAIDHAEATGDDLNVVPETFKPSIEARHPEKDTISVPLQPPDRLEGRFAPAERLPGGWYEQGNDSGATLPHLYRRDQDVPGVPLHPRLSFGSMTSSEATNSAYLPWHVESFMGDEDQKKYLVAQRAHDYSQSASVGTAQNRASTGRAYDLPEDGDMESETSAWINATTESLEDDITNRSGSEHERGRANARGGGGRSRTASPIGSQSPMFRPATPSWLSRVVDASLLDTGPENALSDRSYGSSASGDSPPRSRLRGLEQDIELREGVGRARKGLR